MKHLLQVLIALAAFALITGGCTKEHSYENPTGSTAGTYLWSFGEGTNSYKGPTDTAFVDTLGSKLHLTITGHSSDKKDVISLQLFTDTIKAGTFQSPDCSFDYLRNGVLFYGSDITSVGQFTVTITTIDTVSISGTFYGTAIDSAKKQRTIANGQFKVKFKSKSVSTLPDSSNCSYSGLKFIDSASSVNYYTIASLYNSNTVSNITFTQTSLNIQDNNFVISYPTGKVNLDATGKQYFAVDANGRATAFYGYEDPMLDTTALIVATYTYDGNGHLIQRTHALQAKPTQIEFTANYTWSGNLLTQTVLTSGPYTLAKVVYSYDAGKPVSHFLNMAPFATEMFYFQSAVGTGVVPDHALTGSVATYYDTTGAVTSKYTSSLHDYTIDSHQYVLGFWVSGDDFAEPLAFSRNLALFSKTQFQVSYHCK